MLTDSALLRKPLPCLKPVVDRQSAGETPGDFLRRASLLAALRLLLCNA